MKKIYVFKLYIIKMFLKWVKNEIFIVFIIYKKMIIIVKKLKIKF